jgi:predicted ATPase
MSKKPHDALHELDLDADLLASPDRVETNWHVITGAASCGKTTLIDLLADRGFQTAAETAREYIETETAKGRTLEEIFTDPNTEYDIEELQRRLELGLRPSDVVFLDRAFPDMLYFHRLAGLNLDEILDDALRFRYASVFILDQLPLILDGARIEDDAYTHALDKWLVRDYAGLGYHVVRVPVLSPEERTAFVLDTLSQQGLI